MICKILLVYVGKDARKNLNHGLKNGIWGFKKSVSKELLESKSLGEHAYVIFGSGYSGKKVRTGYENWKKHQLSSLFIAKITSDIYEDNSIVWEDEKTISPKERYIIRFEFDKNSIKKYKDIYLNRLPDDISDNLRKSAIAQSRGYLVEYDINDLEGSISDYFYNIKQAQSLKETKNGKDESNYQQSTKSSIFVKEIIKHAHEYITSHGYQYDYQDIANFYLSLRTKPFVILAGISGTGKTQLPRKFAEALGFNMEEQVVQIPVRPDWTDASDLIGYVSLNGDFISRPLTDTIIKARNNTKKPYFFILDEMNLARVEHYFSDFLSIIETRERDEKGNIITDCIIREDTLKDAKNREDYEKLRWPQNLFLIGTVNMDETTHTFSRKVLDRANSIEMQKVDLDWIDKSGKTNNSLSGIDMDYFVSKYIHSRELSQEDKNNLSEYLKKMKDINILLMKADFQFAYRVRDEIAYYLLLNKKFDLLEKETAFDYQLHQKVLPRIHGSSSRVQIVLIELLNYLEDKQYPTDGYLSEQLCNIKNSSNLNYPLSSNKIIFMLERYNDDRFTSFLDVK